MNANLMGRLRHSLWGFPRTKLEDVSKKQVLVLCARSSSDGKGSGGIPKNTVSHIYSASSQSQDGRIYDRKPFKMRLFPKKNYMWCLCGLSKSQPMCDGTHKLPHMKCELKPIKFQVEEEGDYWLCNCKQTKLRPFCDGTHKAL
ncbi:hypothetical protein ONE63_002143 [Megalurothrips usitatus]|uniref:Iron-binding zinc finger CDGSH type domain-containing protein n=1 Tax=Megalurothrips usitatus TaxID=439358 RepID=A0AAV7XAK0_9NEOP|nr:hypothetical protein ONE63_002143 [Megalurothrips usitatus]